MWFRWLKKHNKHSMKRRRLVWPRNSERTNLTSIGSLTFIKPDTNKFECLNLAFEALNNAGSAPCILNAANEIAVSKFLNKEIKFSHIPLLINKALDKVENNFKADLGTIFECDRKTREYVLTLT